MSGNSEDAKARRFAPRETFTDLGLLIAFLAPGFIVVLSLAPYVPVLQNWPLASANKDWTIGAFLFIALGALSFGVVVDSVRRTCDPYLRGTVRYELSKLKAGDERQLLLPQEWQRFYQFYGNMAVAVLIAGVVWLYQRMSQWLVMCDVAALAGVVTRVGGWAVLEFLLLRSARQSGQEFVYYVENVGVAHIDRSGVFREYCKQRQGDLERSDAQRHARGNGAPWWQSVVRQLPWRVSDLQ